MKGALTSMVCHLLAPISTNVSLPRSARHFLPPQDVLDYGGDSHATSTPRRCAASSHILARPAVRYFSGHRRRPRVVSVVRVSQSLSPKINFVVVYLAVASHESLDFHAKFTHMSPHGINSRP